MLFAGVFTRRPNVSEASERRTLQLFTNWTPPDGFTFKANYAFADSTGGLFIAESTAEAMAEATGVWNPHFEFRVWPIVDANAMVPTWQRVMAWRDGVR